MTDKLKEDTDRRHFFLSIGINIWLYFLAFFTLLFGNLMPVIIFGIGGAAFILMGVSKRIRKYELKNYHWHYNSFSDPDSIQCNGSFKGHYYNI